MYVRRAIVSGKTKKAGFYNLGQSSFTNLFKAIKSGTKATIMTTGESTTSGTGSTTTLNTWPGQMYSVLLAAGYPVAFDAWGGFFSSDSRAVFTGTTGYPSTLQGLTSGSVMSAGSTFAYTPTSSFDKVDFYYATVSGTAGAGTVNIDGGATLLTIATNATSGITKATFSPTLGTHTINIACSSGSIYPMIIDPYNSTQNKIRVIPGGIPGQGSPAFGSGGSVYIPAMLTAFQPTTTIINTGINDEVSNNPDPISDGFQANIQTFITNAKAASSDVLLVGMNAIENPPVATTATEETQLAFIRVLQGLARTNNIGMYNIRDVMSRWDVANANGQMSDQLHPNNAGYAVIGRLMANGIIINKPA